MRFPKMNKQALVTAKVPQLSGGVNLQDAYNRVEDHQLTDCNNVWWHDAALRTRPGLAVSQIGQLPVGATGTVGRFEIRNPVHERETLLGQMLPSSDGKAGTFRGYSLELDNGISFLGQRTDVELNADGSWSGFSVKASKGSDTDYYFFLSDGSVLQQGENPTDGTERKLVDAVPYVPLVMVNGWGNAASGEGTTPGVLYEGFNMLTGAFRCSYTTDGESSHFNLPVSGLTTTDMLVDGDTVSVAAVVELTLTSSTTNQPKTFTFTLRYVKQNPKLGDDDTYCWRGTAEIPAEYLGDLYDDNGIVYAFELDLETGVLRTQHLVQGSYVSAEMPNMNGIVQNNLVVQAYKSDDGGNSRDTICQMTRCVWFGGDRSGINGGTRLFVCGNHDQPNLVHWSDVNNPLYFPENNYAYIGSGDEAVTGFGRQGELLVIFKEHEVYAAQYVAGTGFTYEDVVSGAVTDVTAYMAQFPITSIHSTIGCDCPDTIRLVNNRLVWADSTGRVYMLPTVNQYNERNVREVSPNIRARLQEHDPASLKRAVSGEFQGYYTLLANETMYLLDADTSAFASFHYYASQDKAQRNLPWYIWHLNAKGDEWMAMVSDGDRMRLLKQPVYAPLYGEQTWTLYDVDGDTDGGEAIDCRFVTKMFDFDRADVKKAVTQLYIGLTAADGCRVRVSYLTDDQTMEDAYILEGAGDTRSRDPQAYRLHRMTPNVHRVSLFGVQVTCEGPMAATGMTIKYKQQGVVR